MPGRGPAPKDPAKRARRNAEAVAVRVIEAHVAEQPELPTRYVAKTSDDEGNWREEVDWPLETVKWWRMWGESPIAGEFTATDWSELLIAAFLHAEFMEGNIKVAAELRLRTAKFGATPEDRLRLRWQVATAAGAEADAVTKTVRARSSRERYGNVKPVPALEAS